MARIKVTLELYLLKHKIGKTDWRLFYWMLKNCPGILDNQIIKLIGTTKSTIEAIKERTHWNIKNIIPRDPVLLGLCSQVELDKVTDKLKLSPPAPTKAD